jgi:hypothetical protein
MRSGCGQEGSFCGQKGSKCGPEGSKRGPNVVQDRSWRGLFCKECHEGLRNCLIVAGFTRFHFVSG